MVPVVNPNGKIRICVDLRKLIKAVKRERYVLPTLEDVAPETGRSKSVFEIGCLKRLLANTLAS